MAIKASSLGREKPSGGIYYIDGGDTYWQKFAENAFRSLLTEDSLSLFLFDRITGLNEPLSALDTIGFFGGENVVIVRDSDYKATPRDHNLLAAAEAGDNYLLFVNVKFLTPEEKKRFINIDCKKSDRFECATYAEKFFTDGIDRAATAKLVEYADCDMAKIENEAKKLVDYCDGRKVTVEDVLNLVADDAEAQIFSFVQNVVEGRKSTAEKQLDRLLKFGNSPSALLAALIGQYRRMLYGGLSKKSDLELAEVMNVKEYAIKKARSGKKVGNKRLKRELDMLTDYEYKFKSGALSDRAALRAATARLLGEEV